MLPDLRIFRNRGSQELSLYMTVSRQSKGTTKRPYECAVPAEELEIQTSTNLP